MDNFTFTESDYSQYHAPVKYTIKQVGVVHPLNIEAYGVDDLVHQLETFLADGQARVFRGGKQVGWWSSLWAGGIGPKWLAPREAATKYEWEYFCEHRDGYPVPHRPQVITDDLDRMRELYARVLDVNSADASDEAKVLERAIRLAACWGHTRIPECREAIAMCDTAGIVTAHG